MKHCGQASEAQLNAPVQEIIRENAGAAYAGSVRVDVAAAQTCASFLRNVCVGGAYQRHVEGLLARQNVGFIDASHWFPEGERFGDALHLNDEGARLFSQRLGAMCGNVNQLDACGK